MSWLNEMLGKFLAKQISKQEGEPKERFVTIPTIVYGPGTLNKIKYFCEKRYLDLSSVATITGPTTSKYLPDLKNQEVFKLNKDEDHYSIYSRLKTELSREKPSLLIGLGGGTKLDLTKILATELKIPYILIPTSLSNDGIASNFAVSKEKRATIGVAQASLIIADYTILKEAEELNKSGLGDVLSNYNASHDWYIANKNIGKEKTNFSETIYYILKSISLICLESSLEKEKISDFIDTLFLSIVGSGACMNSTGSSICCSGAEHTLEKILDLKVQHGLAVSALSLPMTALWDRAAAKKCAKALAKHKMPCCLSDLGLSKNEFLEAVKGATFYRTPKDTGEFDYRQHRYTILNQIFEKNPDKLIPKVSKAAEKIGFFK